MKMIPGNRKVTHRILAMLLSLLMLLQGTGLAEELAPDAAPFVETEASVSTDTEAAPEIISVVDYSESTTMLDAGMMLPPAYFEGTLVFEGPDYTVTAAIGADAMFPKDVEMRVDEIMPGTELYNHYAELTDTALSEDWDEVGEFARFFDISFVTFADEEEVEIEPQAYIDVQITFREVIAVDEETDVQAVHFDAGTPQMLTTETDSNEAAVTMDDAVDTVSFSSDTFSVYGVFQKVRKTIKVITAGGETYNIDVSYSQDTEIPNNAELVALELLPGMEGYSDYVAKSEEALGMDAGSAEYIRLFDIKIVNKDDTAIKYQPAEGTSVDVSIELADKEASEEAAESTQVVHFADGEDEGSPVNAETNGQTVSFAADGFSIYAIVGGDPSTGDTYSVKYTFVLEDGTPFYFTNENGDSTNIQYVRDGEKPINPGTPTASTGEQEDKEFAGWWTKNGSEWGEELDFNTPVSTTAMQRITVYARYDNTQYITYYDENGTVYLVDRRFENDTVLTTDVKNASTGEKWTEQELEEHKFVAYQPLSRTTAFLGWTATQGKTTPDDNFTITEARTLYPVIAEVKWITYHSGPVGSNSTYFAAEYALDGNWNRNNLVDHVPTRAGYRFDGWYIRNTATQGDDENLNYSWTTKSSDVKVTDANGNFTNNFKRNSAYFENGKLKNDIELVAHWTPTMVNYVFVYYQQEPNANADGAYEYVYKDSRTASGLAGSNTGTPPRPDWDDIAGFTLHQTNDSSDPYNVKTQVIEGDGSTVVNVYYDRNTYTVTFNQETESYNISNSNSNGNYYIPDGNGGYTQVYLYRNNRRWYIYNWGRYIEYNGNIYEYNHAWTPIDELTITAKYGEDVSQLWPDKRTDLTTVYPSIWYTSETGSTAQSGLGIMPPNNLSFYNRPGQTGSEDHLKYWLQDLPASSASAAPNTFTLADDSILWGDWNTTWDDYWIYEGFTINIRATDAATINRNNGVEAATTNSHYSISDPIGTGFRDAPNRTINVYYLRNKYSVTFRQGNSTVGSDEYYYEADISGADKYSSAVSVPAGMRFAGWYDNPDCIGDRYTFDGKTMPPNNLILYAKIVPEEYYVRLDYNGGETKGSESTFAWVNYGETIEEAEDVKRDYVPAGDGETGTHNYVYWRYDEAADAAGDGWWSYYEDANGNKVYNNPKDYSQRTATYVEAAGGRYRYDPGKYTFVGWYETDEAGNQLSNVPFNFATQITRNTYLKAVFRKEGTFQVRYLSAMGTEGTEDYVAGDTNTAPPTDSYTYIDLSEAKVGHSIEPADNKYQFAGWRIKGTAGPVYQPGETFPINSDYSEEENGIHYITLEPVFIQKGDTQITYVINTPTGATATSSALTGLTDNTQDKLIVNGEVTLHDGTGFTVPGYKLIGWSDKPIEVPANEIFLKDGTYQGTIPSDTHIFRLGGTYGVSDEEGNTLYAVWSPTKVEFTKSVAVEGSLELSQVNHIIYIALTKDDKETFVRDESGNIMVKEIRIVNGVPSPETVVFYGLEDGEYNVWELKDTTGSRLGVSDVFPIQGANPAANFAVKSIAGDNNVTISEEHPTAETALTNTYTKEDEAPVKFEANKVWIDRRANVIPSDKMPANATATLSLYREINGQVETDPVGHITLDGHIDETEADFMEDAPWHASFGNLPRVDDQGNRITYMVKETAATPDGFYPWKLQSQNNDAYGPNDYLKNSGGTIYNRKLTMSIRLDKHFDFQPNNGDEQAVTYDYFKTDTETQEKLSFTVTLPTGEVRYFKLSDFKPKQGVTTFSLTLDDIPYYTGLYAPEGYNGSTITFQESGEFELLEKYNYHLVNITPDNGAQWNIGSPRPESVTATRTVTMNINADDPLVEVRIQNKYRRGAEGKFVRITKKVTGLTAADFTANQTMLQNLHFVIRNKAGYYAGINPNPAFNPETLRYEKLRWVQDVSEAEVIAATFNYNGGNGEWEASFNLSNFGYFPSDEYTVVELEALEGGYNGVSANIDGYVLTVKDNTITVDTHSGGSSEWGDSYDYTLHVTNDYGQIAGPVRFTKVNESNAALGGAAFALYTDQNCTVPARDTNGQNAVATSATGTGLTEFLNIPIGTYYMKETAAPEGYSIIETIYVVTVTEKTGGSEGPETEFTIKEFKDGAATGENVTHIVNPSSKLVKILKTDNGGKPLAGAVFSLYTESGYAADPKQAAQTGLTSGTDGMIDLGELAYGKYYLVETSAPAGYVLLSAPVEITVAADGVTYIQEGSNVPVIHQNETDPYTLTVINTPGVELPATGGPGTLGYTIAGLALVLAAGVLLLSRKRRQTR